MLSIPVRASVRFVLPLVILAAATPLAGQQPTPPQTPAGEQREHVVRRGDTLWDLARAYLANPFLWPLIFEANRNVVENPHWIYPAERLIIPPVLAQQDATAVAAPLSAPEPAVEAAAPEPVVVAALDLRRPVVPVAEYQAAPWLSASAEREVVGRIVQPRDPSAGTDRLATALRPGDELFIGELAGARAPGDSLLVVRFGRRVGDRGRIVEPLAVLHVESMAGRVAVARVVRQFGETRVGDAVIPHAGVPAIGTGEAQAVAGGMEGQLLQFLMQEPLHGTTDLAFVSLGTADGVGIGDEFAVYVPARAASRGSPDVLPPTDVATVRVVKVTDRAATVRVLAVNSTALRDGLPVRMIRKMP